MIRHILLLLCCSYLCLLSNHSLLRVAEREMGGEAEGERGGMVEVPIVGEDESARGGPNRTTAARPSWMGVKLFPPRRTQLNPSKAWQFGGFKKGVDGQLITDKTVCGLCGKEQKFRQTPTNLFQHLQNCHPLETGIEPSGQSNPPSIKDFFNKTSKASKYKPTHPKQRQLKKKIVQWIISSKRPISIVEDQIFKESYEVADPKLKVPSRWEVTAEIRKLFKEKKAQVVGELSQVEHFCCTNDAGSSSGGKSFVDVNVHYLTKNFEPKKKIVSVFEMKESKNAINYRSRIEKAEKSVGIEGKVFSYTTDNEATMKAAFSRDNRNGCFAHIVSKSCKNVLEKQKAFTSMREKLRKIAKKAKKSSKFKYGIEKEQVKRGLRLLTLKQEVKTRFTATHTMVRSFLNDPNEKKEEEMDDEKVNANIEAINAAMVSAKFTPRQLVKLTLKSEDVLRMKQLVKVHLSSFIKSMTKRT